MLAISKLLPEYQELVQMVATVNKLVKFLMAQINLTLIPLIGSLVVFVIAPTENWIQLTVKYAISASSGVYSIRGTVLTLFLSQLDFQSKVLYNRISASIARGNVKNMHSKIWLRKMMEDLSCGRNHLLMREYTGGVTQMDVFEFVIGVVQFTMLFIDFGREFTSNTIV